MRPIKFQVLDRDDFHIVGYDILDNNHFWSIAGQGGLRRQFTGLLDKNGKEIYDGDILQYEIVHNGEKKIKIHSVLWEDNDPTRTPGFRINDNERYCPMRLDVNTIYITGMEVIGNIYENPELLSNQ